MNAPTNKKGFTIIEVVLVLAIAGLIFLMVFIALPALQRGQRDSQRRSDVSRINTQISNYQTNSRGKIPTATQMTAPTTGFVTKYLKGGATKAGDEYSDPSEGTGYTITTGAADPTRGQINYQTSMLCDNDGVANSSITQSDGTVLNATPRNYVLRIFLEGQNSPYCIDNRS
jgi:prepilin-type N-terminal cleavage/methylation domain-containing protein